MDLSSFTAGADYRVFGTTITGFSGGSADTLRDIIASGTTAMLEAEDEYGATASASNACDTIVAIVDVAPERGAREWNVITGIGVFTGSFIIKFVKEAAREESCELTNTLKAGGILWSIK